MFHADSGLVAVMGSIGDCFCGSASKTNETASSASKSPEACIIKLKKLGYNIEANIFMWRCV
jgi:hypothetical protein